MGVALIAAQVEQLFEAAGTLTFSLLVDLDSITAREARDIVVGGGSASELLAAWIRELMVISDREGLLFCRFRVDGIEPQRVRGAAWGEKIDPARHQLRRDPEKVVLHEAQVTKGEVDIRARLSFALPGRPR